MRNVQEGLAAVEFNDIFPDFKFQKLLPIEKAKNVEWPMWMSEKYDGVFCAAAWHEGNIHIFSRTGKEYKSMKHIADSLRILPFKANEIVLFEAYANVPQSVLSGWVRDTKNQHPEIIAMVHKVVDPMAGTFMYVGDTSVNTLPKCLEVVNHILVSNLEKAMKKANLIWARGGEGIVLECHSKTYYPGKRNNTAIKIKQSDTYDLEVVDIIEGKGKYIGKVGALKCRFGDGTIITCGGMTDRERQDWWDDPSSIIGKVVEVMAMRDSSKGKLREPRYKGIRDKVDIDYSI